MLYLYSVFMHFLLNLSYLLFRMGQLYCFNWSPTSFDSTIITRLQGIWKNVILSSWKTSSKRYIWTFLSIPIVCLKILPNGLYMKNTFNIKKKNSWRADLECYFCLLSAGTNKNSLIVEKRPHSHTRSLMGRWGTSFMDATQLKSTRHICSCLGKFDDFVFY